MKMSVVLTLLAMLGTQKSLAGGGGAGAVISYQSLVQCQPDDASETRIQKLIYFVRSESEWSTSLQPGVSIEGSQLSASIYALKGDLDSVLQPSDAPQSLPSNNNNFYAVGGNVRALSIRAKGQKISVSMVAGATGNVKVENLVMTCSAVQSN